MKLSRPEILLVIGFLIAGCDSLRIAGTPRGLEYAAVTNSCGPTDGPAVEIFLVPEPMESLDQVPPTPYVRFSVARPLDELEGRRLALTGPESEGGAWYHTSANEFEIATYGVLTVLSVAADSTVRGEVNLMFPGGRHVWGGFRATWFDTDRRCG